MLLENSGSCYGGERCSKGHYSEDCGNYHTSVIVNGKEVAYFGDCSTKEENEMQIRKIQEAVEQARKEWLERQ